MSKTKSKNFLYNLHKKIHKKIIYKKISDVKRVRNTGIFSVYRYFGLTILNPNTVFPIWKCNVYSLYFNITNKIIDMKLKSKSNKVPAHNCIGLFMAVKFMTLNSWRQLKAQEMGREQVGERMNSRYGLDNNRKG